MCYLRASVLFISFRFFTFFSFLFFFFCFVSFLTILFSFFCVSFFSVSFRYFSPCFLFVFFLSVSFRFFSFFSVSQFTGTPLVIISNYNEIISMSRCYPSTLLHVILKSQGNICIVIYFLHLCITTTPLTYSSTLPSCCESVKVQIHVQYLQNSFFSSFLFFFKYNNT